MARPTRRDFLKLGATAFGYSVAAKWLTACGAKTLPSPTSQMSRSPVPPLATQTAPQIATGAASPAPTSTVPSPPDIAVARHGTPETLVRSAVAALGGMERFVAKGANVIVKPNICVAYHTYEYAATTNPWVVAAVVKLCLEAGAGNVTVLDMPFGGTQQAAYAISGIQEQVEAAGGTMAPMPDFKYTVAHIPDASKLNDVEIFEDILKADAVINVPIAKVHSLSRLTLGMKNLMGVVKDRPQMHGYLSANLTDLASLIRPKLTIIDAVRTLVSNGPTGGSLDDVKQLDTVVASPDIVAADSYGATLFGLRPEGLPCVATAAKKGLGRSDLENLRIEEIEAGGA